MLPELEEDDTEKVIETIRRKLKENEFESAARDAMAHGLEMKRRFTFDEMIIPLVLQNKKEIFSSYLTDMLDYQKEYCNFLESFLLKPMENVMEQLAREELTRKIKIVRKDRFFGHSLMSTLLGLFNKSERFNFQLFAPRDAREWLKVWLRKIMNWLINQRFRLNFVDDIIFYKFAENLMKSYDPEDMKLFFNDLLDEHDEDKQVEAIAWFKFRNLDLESEEVSVKMRQFLENNKNNFELFQKAAERLRNRSLIEYYKEGTHVFFQNRSVPLFMITTESELVSFCLNLREFGNDNAFDKKMIGFDIECTHDAFMIQNEGAMKCSTMQISFAEKVFIIDCVKLKESNCSKCSWRELISNLFCSEKISLIDVHSILSIKTVEDSVSTSDVKNVFCLRKLAENIQITDPTILDLNKDTVSLRFLAEKLLGVTLDKKEKMSAWHVRPLRQAQVKYAALDAMVVPPMFSTILDVLKQKKKDFDIDLYGSWNALKLKKDNNEKFESFEKMPWNEMYRALCDRENRGKLIRKTCELKLVVDVMIQKLGRNLRRCGVDVIVSKEKCEFLSQLGKMKRDEKNEQRYALTSSSKCVEQLGADYGDSLILLTGVGTMSQIDQLYMIFDRFNLHIDMESLWSRCVECNSLLIVQFPQEVIKCIHEGIVVRGNVEGYAFKENCRKLAESGHGQVKMKWSISERTILVETSEGVLNMKKNLLRHHNSEKEVEVALKRIDSATFKRPPFMFYLCSGCGNVSYDKGRIDAV